MNLVLLFENDFAGPDHVILGGRRREHALGIHRAEVGDTLRVGVLDGNVGTGKVIGVSEGTIEMEIVVDQPPPPPAPLCLLLALPRPKSLKKALAAAITMGVKHIVLLRTRRVEPGYWQSPVLSPESLRKLSILALEQARDTIMPHIDMRKRFKPFVEDELPALAKGTRALVAHPNAATMCPRGLSSPATLCIGPEGGFIPYELDLLAHTGFHPVSIGPRPLRVEQAVAALIGRLF
ncbi:MAG: 16S rRNA (uracil(1498)-N(3))-methyltransferase [Chitinivibrionales bacterium]|nr:16S rRNA (uracil(1498)-N(3))-methyltransferase [Chitinivibrionales bacterium]MBD3358109.1 16S rRNA (uracil(1498)-N(3))-methyltransferase [Chitinivibrionales bacterium]